MSISFNYISSALRTPGVYAEISNVRAGYFLPAARALIIGQSINSVTETPVIVPSADWAKSTFGAGSQLARLVTIFRANNPDTELFVLPLNDAVGSAAATATVTITGPATANGTIALYVGGDLVNVPVISGDTATAIGDSLVAALTANPEYLVSGSNASGVVTLTAKNKGTVANYTPIVLNYRGVLSNEKIPSGVTVTLSSSTLTGGATDPLLSTKLSAIGSQPFDAFVHPYADTTNIAAFTAFLNDSSGRWSPTVALDGHAFTARPGTLSALQTVGQSLNDQHQTLIGYEVGVPDPSIDVLAAYAGQAIRSLAIDSARPLQTLPLIGVNAPVESARFSQQNRNSLLYSGVATVQYLSGSPAIERSVTTYQKNSFGQSDPSELDIETLFTLSYIKKSATYRLTQKFPRSKLAANGTKFGQGQAIVTPNDVRAELCAWYGELEELGLVQNLEGFKQNTIVELDNDPSRLNILLAPSLVNGLRVTAIKIEFALK